MSTSLQAKILRVLESGEIERVGGAETHTVNVRVISATNQDLNEKIKEGKFREDLFHRINVFPVTLPPLRERKVDIPLLTYAIFKALKKKHNLNVSYIAPKAIDRLIDYSWPGNVRELENTLERALLICNNKFLTEKINLKKPGKIYLEDAQYYIEDIRKSVISSLSYDKVYNQGFNINTPINLEFQKSATSALREGLTAYDKRKGWRGALINKDYSKKWDNNLEQFDLEKSINWEIAIVKNELYFSSFWWCNSIHTW